MKFIKVILLLFISVFIIVFSVSNREVVTIDLFPFPLALDVPLFIVVLAAMAIGVLLHGLNSLGARINERRQNYLNTKKIKALENEIEGMKADKIIKTSL